MLKIKLARFGKRHQPHYRIVINEARDKRDGSYVVAIGRYAPTQQPKTLEVDLEAYKSWLAKGAQPTDTVAALVKRFESGTPFPAKKPQLSKKAKAKAAAEAEAKKTSEEAVEATPTTEPAVNQDSAQSADDAAVSEAPATTETTSSPADKA